MDTERTEKPRTHDDIRRDLATEEGRGSLTRQSPTGRLVRDVPALLAELDDSRAQLADAVEFNRANCGRADRAEKHADGLRRRTEAAEAALAQRDATIARIRDFCNASVLQQSQDSGCFVADEDVTVTVAEIEALLPAGAAVGGEPETAEPASGYRVVEHDEGAELVWVAASDEPARCPHGKTEAHYIGPKLGETFGFECRGPAASGTPEAP